VFQRVLHRVLVTLFAVLEKLHLPPANDAVAVHARDPPGCGTIPDPMNDASPISARLPRWLLPALLVAAVAVVYGQTVGFEFVNYDDVEYVTKNSPVRAGLTAESLRWAWTTTEHANWHPLTWMSLILDSQVGGMRPAMFHLTNVVLHAANVLLVFALFVRLTGARLAAAFVAGVLAVHPLHVESVAWIAERKDVLGAFFGFAAIHLYLRWVGRRDALRYALVCATLIASLLSKPTFVTFPFLLLLLDFWPLARLRSPADLRPLLVEKLAFFLLVAASAAITVTAQRAGGAMVPWDVYPLRVRVANAILSYVEYLRTAFFPSGLAVPYPHPHGTTSFAVLAACLALLVGITTAVLFFARSRRYAPVGWFWYVGALVPMIGIVQVGAQARADRYMYVPLIGISMLAAWGVPDLAAKLGIEERTRQRALTALGFLVVGVLAIAAHRQASIWRNGITLFTNAVRVTERNETAENNLGSAYYAQDQMEEALVHYEASVAYYPRYALALNNLAGVLEKLGRTGEAIARWEEAVRYRPDFDDGRSNLAGALFKVGRVDEAIAQCEAALRNNPKHGASHYNLGRIRLAQGRPEEARQQLEAAVAAMPDDAAALVNLGVALAQLGQIDEAVARFEKALVIDPGHEGAKRNLARARSRQQGAAAP